eukprot:2012452-Pyramimonas_sp.AAC.1
MEEDEEGHSPPFPQRDEEELPSVPALSLWKQEDDEEVSSIPFPSEGWGRGSVPSFSLRKETEENEEEEGEEEDEE